MKTEQSNMLKETLRTNENRMTEIKKALPKWVWSSNSSMGTPAEVAVSEYRDCAKRASLCKSLLMAQSSPSPSQATNQPQPTNTMTSRYITYTATFDRIFVLDNLQLSGDGILAHAIVSEHHCTDEAQKECDRLNERWLTNKKA
jgi:hypothetical protein